MNKKFFSSLMLGFGGTLAVLIAIAMPPGGWGVTVGVMLGLLGCIPLFIVSLMVLSRDRRRPEREVKEETPQQVPVIIVQQPALPYGAQYAQPEAGLYGPETYAYGYMEAPEGYGYYPQGYLAQPQPQAPRQERRAQAQPPKPNRSRPRLQPGYYPEQNPAEYEQQYYYPQQDAYYPQAEIDPELYEYYYSQPQPEYYEEPQPPARPSRRARYAQEYDEGYAATYPTEQPRRPAPQPGRPRRSKVAPATLSGEGEVIDAQYRTIGGDV